MELKYEFDSCGELTNIILTGLDGFEHVSSIKEAVETMIITNPSKSFSLNYKLACYVNKPTNMIEQQAAVANTLSTLWKRLDEPDKTCSEMNIAMLLVNSLVMNVRQAKEIELLKKKEL